MNYRTVPFDSHMAETVATIQDPGVLLVSAGQSGRANVMAIGWGVIGEIWGKPIFTVLVRPSRYTYGLIEESQAFTVCVPGPEQRSWVDLCGNRSGRDGDKFQALGLTPWKGTQGMAPGVAGCPRIYECRVAASSDMVSERIVSGIRQEFYASGDYHRAYYGEIVAVHELA